jgi:Zn-finger nucleic acid-binding protein
MRTHDEVSAMQCPVCRVPLSMSDRQGIEIDYCPQCRGVWLDRGELDKIVERSAGPAPSAPPRQEIRHERHERRREQPWGSQPGGYGYGQHGQHGHHRKRKSWLEEIFD